MQLSNSVGIPRAVDILKRAIDARRMSHALLLLGPEGNGKLALAASLAAYLNCKQKVNGDACGVCSNCSKSFKLIHPDIHFILPVASNPDIPEDQSPSAIHMPVFRKAFLENPYIELEDWTKQLQSENKQLNIAVRETRALKRQMYLHAFEAEYKVAIIWHAEKMNIQSANALLKLLEEPPERTILILTATDTSTLLPTITSRCQSVLVNRIAPEDIQKFLVQKYQVEEDRALQIALLSDGSIRKAITLIEPDTQLVSEKFPHWLRLCYEGNIEDLIKLSEAFARENREFQKFFFETALQRVRDTIKARYFNENQLLFPAADKAFLKKLNTSLTEYKLEQIAGFLNNTLQYTVRNANTQIQFVALSLRIHKVFKEKQKHNLLYKVNS